MKTFKLVSLTVLEKQNDELLTKEVNLKDGLIINREDDKNHWLIEAYLDKEYKDFFETIKKEKRERVLQVKITKITNSPATFLVKLLKINNIGPNINVLFLGTIINLNQKKVEKTLKDLIDEGYQGNELLKMFKTKTEGIENTSS